MSTVWIVLIIALLVVELIKMELVGACGAVGSACGLIAYFLGLNWYFQVPIAIIVTLLLIVLVRPIGLKYVNRMKKESDKQNLVGLDAIVLTTIDNAQGVGVVSINGKQWSAKSHRPNTVISAGTLVKVVAMNKNTAIVDDRVRKRR